MRKLQRRHLKGAAWAASEHNIPGVWHGWFICQVLDQTSYAVEPDEFTYGGTYYREHGPRIGDNWVNIAVACLTPETRKTLIGLREFAFEKHPKYNLPDWRLEALTAEMHAIIDAILEKDALRTKQIAVK